MNALLIVNPVSGATLNPDLLPDLLEIFKQQNLEVDVKLTTPEEDGQALAAEAARNGTEKVFVAGGDGTIEAIVRGLAHTETILGIIPFGTRNNLAASLNIPNDLTQAVQVLAEGEVCPMDLGKVNDHYFLEVVGIGLEASLFPCGDGVKDGIKKNYFTAFKSIFSGIKTFYEFRNHRIVLRLDGKRKHYPRTFQVNICNSPRYGVEFDLAPNAKMNDGKLDVIYLDYASKWDHLRHFFTAMRGQSFKHERLRNFQAATIEVKSFSPLEVHADGTCVGHTPIRVEVVPKALRVIVPTSKLIAEFAANDDSSNKIVYNQLTP
jgi:diacylglycerol kinase (ATP)